MAHQIVEYATLALYPTACISVIMTAVYMMRNERKRSRLYDRCDDAIELEELKRTKLTEL